MLWRNFATSPDDALLAISTSGCNAVTIDVAMEAKRLGRVVVAMTSLAHAAVSAITAESKAKSCTRLPTSSWTSRPRPETRLFGSRDWRRQSRRCRASRVVRSSTW